MAAGKYIHNEGHGYGYYYVKGTNYDDTISNEQFQAAVYAGAGNDEISNLAGAVEIYGEDGDDYILNYSTAYGNGIVGYCILNGGTGNDTIVNEGKRTFIYGVKGNDIISLVGGYATIGYNEGDGNDLIYGFGDWGGHLQIGDGNGSYSSTTSSDNKDVIITVGDGKITLVGAATLNTLNIAGKKVASTLQVITDKEAAKVTVDAAVIKADASARTTAIYLVGNALDNSLLGGSGKDSFYGKDGNDYLVGNAGADKLYGQNGADTLYGGDGKDTLSGGSGNDTLTGGAGNDLFVYTAGNDVITDYAAGDKISISAAIAKSSIKGSDAIFTIGLNTLTVKNGKGREIAFIDADGTERTIIGGAYLANDSSNAKATLASWREVGDASARTSAIYLVGNALDNTILGGSGKDSLYGKDGDDYLAGGAGNDRLFGQAGDDSLWGGTGNDTLKGGDGADVFIYNNGDGKDVISDFARNDFLQISKTFTGTYNESANTIAFKFGSTANAITLKNFTATTFNINGNAYQISGSKLVKK